LGYIVLKYDCKLFVCKRRRSIRIALIEILTLSIEHYLSSIIFIVSTNGLLYILDLAGHNIKNTTSIRRMPTPARHKSKPVSDPMKNKAAIKDKAATKKSMI